MFACIAVAGLAAAGYFFLPKILKQTQQAAPVVSALLSDTPRPSTASPSTPTISPSLPLPPSETPLPALPAATLEPSETPLPSETPIPSATPLSIGGGGLLAFSSNRGDGTTYQLWTMHVYMNDQGQVAGGDFAQLTDGPGISASQTGRQTANRLRTLRQVKRAKTSL